MCFMDLKINLDYEHLYWKFEKEKVDLKIWGGCLLLLLLFGGGGGV